MTAQPDPFADLLTANQKYADSFALSDLEGVARAGVAIVTCMDARVDPLAIVGLAAGDAKVLRNPGGRVTDPVLVGLVLAVQLLRAERVLVVEHTRCAMASADEASMRRRLSDSGGADASWMSVGMIDDQRAAIADDVARVRAHPLVPASVSVGGFLYDVDTGLLQRVE